MATTTPLATSAPPSPQLHHPACESQTTNICEALVSLLTSLGIQHAYGVAGGAAAKIGDALGRSTVHFVHCRHEAGAAFAAVETYFATGRPAVVFTTTGPGIMNALTGCSAARHEGAKIVLLSAGTSAASRGRWACQETSSYRVPISGLFTAGPLFDYAVMMEHPSELAEIAARLERGLARPGGFVAHISIPTALQSTTALAYRRPCGLTTPPSCSDEAIQDYAQMLRANPFVIWVGYGARAAAAEIRTLAERTGAPVMSSPRGKGIFPERHELFLGVTGLGGYGSIEEFMRTSRPAYTLVLGTRLGEATSFWQQNLVPEQAFIHVDIDPEVPGTSYPEALTHAVHADVKSFIAALLDQRLARPSVRVAPSRPPDTMSPKEPLRRAAVRPTMLMDAVQRVVVDGSDAIVMAESGNAFTWAIHRLRFDVPGRFRVSVAYGSMGHMAAGVLGASLARGDKAVAIVGDGAMLMNNEMSTAAQHRAKAVWIILNDAGYGMVEQGMRALGLQPRDTSIPRVDFVQVARGLGVEGMRVDDETALESALVTAMAADGPYVVDVQIDATEPGPWVERTRALILQGTTRECNDVEGLS